jgi:uncharacterized protein
VEVTGVTGVIPDLAALVDAVMAAATHPHSHLHGPPHWKCVTLTAHRLLVDTSAADPVVPFLFGLLHDCKRQDDGHDPQHGPRAAVFADTLNGSLFHLRGDRMSLLATAIRYHTDPVTSHDPTVGLCWDADRLNLCRLGIRPNPRYLSTPAGKLPAQIAAAESLDGQRASWADLYALFASEG